MSVNIVDKSTGNLTKIAGNPIEQASGISYDHTSSGMQANNVQAAVDELKNGLTNLDVALSVPNGTGKNVLPITLNGIKALNTSGTWDGNDYAINGITYTIVTDASGNITSITADGTSTDRARLFLVYGNISKFSNMILSGCSNGKSNYGIFIQMLLKPWTIYATNRDGDTTISTISSSDSNIFIEIADGKTVDNIAFYPMIRDARISDATFAPYIPSVDTRLGAVESGLDDVNNLLLSRVHFNSTLGVDVLQFAKNMENDTINFFKNSNRPANCPSSIGYGAYIFFKCGDATSIICFDKEHIAFTYSISNSTETITWKEL